MRIGSWRGLMLGLMVLLAGVAARADVVSPELELPATSDSFLQFAWQIDSSLPVAAVNGILTYDPAYFSEPRIFAMPGTVGFNVLGNEAVPGRFHFVIYANPTAALPLGSPIAEFLFRTGENLPIGTTTLTFKSDLQAAANTGAASRVDGISFGDAVTFNPITVQINTSSRDWSLYE